MRLVKTDAEVVVKKLDEVSQQSLNSGKLLINTINTNIKEYHGKSADILRSKIGNPEKPEDGTLSQMVLVTIPKIIEGLRDQLSLNINKIVELDQQIAEQLSKQQTDIK